MSTTRRELLRNSALTGAGIMLAGSFGPLFDVGMATRRAPGRQRGTARSWPTRPACSTSPTGSGTRVLYRSQAWSTLGVTPEFAVDGRRRTQRARRDRLLLRAVVRHDPGAEQGTECRGCGPGAAHGAHLRPRCAGRHDQPRRRLPGPAGAPLRQHRRHDPQLRRRSHAVGHLAHLRRRTIRRMPPTASDTATCSRSIPGACVPRRCRSPAWAASNTRRSSSTRAAAIVYLTEDASGPNGVLYKFVPNNKRGRYGSLQAGGKLYAMKAADLVDLSEVTEAGRSLPGDVGAGTEPRPRHRRRTSPYPSAVHDRGDAVPQVRRGLVGRRAGVDQLQLRQDLQRRERRGHPPRGSGLDLRPEGGTDHTPHPVRSRAASSTVPTTSP